MEPKGYKYDCEYTVVYDLRAMDNHESYMGHEVSPCC